MYASDGVRRRFGPTSILDWNNIMHKRACSALFPFGPQDYFLCIIRSVFSPGKFFNLMIDFDTFWIGGTLGRLRSAMQTKATMQNSSGNTWPKEDL